MGLNPVILEALTHAGFKTPTPIQEQTIPPALEGRDVVGSAQTGTGKTLAFAIPAVSKLLQQPNGVVLILAPTRELAQQVHMGVKQLLTKMQKIHTALLIGGESMQKQFSKLRANPRVVVGTPGRIIDHIDRKTFRCDNVIFLILDETDRMFNMGFSIQIEKIISKIPKNRQTLMFSATFPAKVEQLAAKYLINPKRISAGPTESTVLRLKQEHIKLPDSEKYDTLLDELAKRPGSIIVFVKTKIGAERLAKNLSRDKHEADAIHGNLRQSRRDRVMREFRESAFRILVATDVAARGLDVSHVQHVINYNLPDDPEDYVHRVGRTARAGAEGCALSFISPSDGRKWLLIQRYMDPTLSRDERESAIGQDENRRPRRGGGDRGGGSFRRSSGNSGGGRDNNWRSRRGR